MDILPLDDPVVRAAVDAIRTGAVEALAELLRRHPALTQVFVGDDPRTIPHGTARSLLHIATDWPGHLPANAATVRVLLAAGADVNARFVGPHRETPLHWAASSDDVAVLDALLDGGADIDADGAVIGGGTPLADAVAFGNWAAARRLVERGATVTLAHAAALGLTDAVAAACTAGAPPHPDELNAALWYAAHGGQEATARLLLAVGADADWPAPWDGSTAAAAAEHSGATELAVVLRDRRG